MIPDCVPTVGYLPLMSGSRQALALNEWTSQCPKVTGTHPMFYNRKSSVVPSGILHYKKLGCLIPCFVIGEAWLQPKKKRKGAGSWVGPKMFGKGGGGVVRARLDNCVAIFQKCYHPDTQVILNLACINIYNNRFQNTLKRNPWKEKKKWSCIKDGKNNKNLSIWQKRKESCVKDGHWEKQVDFKQTLFHTCGQTKKWSKSQIDGAHTNILNLARQYSKRFVKVF